MSARLLPDGSCEFIDSAGLVTRWPRAIDVARAWLEEWRHETFGVATGFINAMTNQAAPGVLDILQVITECASSEELDWIGAGPLEDLLSYSGNGAIVLDDVEELAQRHGPFARALRNVWLGDGVEPALKGRLVSLGARDLSRS